MEEKDDCSFFSVTCTADKAVDSAINSTITESMTKAFDAVMEGVGKAVSSLGTIWVNIGTPNLTARSGTENAYQAEISPLPDVPQDGRTPGDHAPIVEGINVVLGWSMWIAFGVCVLALIATGVRMGMGHQGEGRRHIDRISVILVATIIISAAVGIATAVAPAFRSRGSNAVAYIQDSLWWYMIAFAAFGIVVGSVRMAWEQRAEPGIDLVKSLLTLAVVNSFGLTAVALLTAAADSFSVWIIDGSLNCSVSTDQQCFGGNMALLLAITTATMKGHGLLIAAILGIIVILSSLIQILLMIIRAGMLVILTGVLPISVAATNTETGKAMFKKTVAWIIAFILYKPAAAIIYATAFRLSGTNIFSSGGDGLVSMLVGITMMMLAIFALPALMKLIAPAVAAVAGGGGMTAAALAATATALPAGAVAGGRLFGGGSNANVVEDDSSAEDRDATKGPDGAAASSGPPSQDSTSGAAEGASAAMSTGGGPAGAAAAVGIQAAAGAVEEIPKVLQDATEESAGEADGSK